MVHLSAGVNFLLIWLLVCLITSTSGNNNNVRTVNDRGLKVDMECDEEGLCMNCDKSEMVRKVPPDIHPLLLSDNMTSLSFSPSRSNSTNFIAKRQEERFGQYVPILVLQAERLMNIEHAVLQQKMIKSALSYFKL